MAENSAPRETQVVARRLSRFPWLVGMLMVLFIYAGGIDTWYNLRNRAK